MNLDFAEDLARFGPNAEYPRLSPARARAYCRQLATHHYENFHVASWLLPRSLRPHFHALYAYCRWADDLGDETGGGRRALDLLAWWREELLRCYDGRPRHPVMLALEPTIYRFGIPPEPFLDLLLAFEQDQVVKEYATFSQLLEYCRYSAAPVGRLVLYLLDSFDEERAALSDRICTGLQLANFWQDVSRDLDIGRIYLPAEDRLRFGYSDQDLHARRTTPAFLDMMRFQVDRTHAIFREGMPLVEKVPDRVAGDVELFVRGGLAVLDKIERARYDVWNRPALAKWEKARLLGSVLWQRVRNLFW